MALSLTIPLSSSMKIHFIGVVSVFIEEDWSCGRTQLATENNGSLPTRSGTRETILEGRAGAREGLHKVTSCQNFPDDGH